MKLNLIGYSNPCLRLLPYQTVSTMRYFSTKEDKQEIKDESEEKASPFSRRYREYSYDRKEHVRKMMDVERPEEFEPKKEYTVEGLP